MSSARNVVILLINQSFPIPQTHKKKRTNYLHTILCQESPLNLKTKTFLLTTVPKGNDGHQKTLIIVRPIYSSLCSEYKI